MAQHGRSRRRTLALGIGLALVVGGMAASAWAWLAMGARGVSSQAPAIAATSSRTSAAAPEPARGPLTVVSLGDSVPAATTCDCAGYPVLVGQALHATTGRAVTVRNDATDGWTTSDVENDLGSAQTAADLSNADLVVVEVGANDFNLDRVDDLGCLPAASSECWAMTLTALRTGLTDIVAGIRREDTRPDVRIVLLGYWNLTLDGDVGRAEGQSFVTGSKALTLALNDVIHTVAVANGVTYVDAYAPFKNDASLRLTSTLLDDGDHLSVKGHAVMSAAIMRTLTTTGVVAGLTAAP